MRIIILIVSVMVLSSCNVQYRLLYSPSSFVPSMEELAADAMEFWPSGPNGYRGFIGTAGIKDIKGTVIVFHGNAGTASDRIYYVKTLGALRYRVILAEYPRYGARKGELGEASLVSDARMTVRLAAETYGEPIFLVGESLGCGIVSGVVRDASLKIAGVVLITPWETLLAVAREKFPFLPIAWFMKDVYDNSGNLKGFRGRIAIVGAERDEIIPIRHAQAVYTSHPGKKKMWTIKGVGHNDWPMAVDVPQWREFMGFVEGDDTP
ncbi:MAG: alpha/beta hydrolase [Deltaproteobacteria bacterium]|nr:alpha/beta hydrolase [Deltaproteobacteria bacterium]